ncbi:hypothetical protein BFP77_04585 [Maribacter sp. 4U21]|nr:hypothetical protein BFP77_04585 [Maribacter sp. 4U21]
MSLLITGFACKKSKVGESTNITSFTQLTSKESGIHFANTLSETDSLNYFKFPYIYMGAGVAIGDFDNDGLSDIFFTGNMVPNKLYHNNGMMQFEDVSSSAGIEGDERWYTGVTLVDINNDGYLDIYLSVSGMLTNTQNQLYINNGDLTFTESASKYGINDSSNSIQSTFFDYDNDGDLDLFVANYPLVPISQGNMFYAAKLKENLLEESGHLYRNNNNGSFEDVTEIAGVKNFGLTLGLIASDFNNDGLTDLYLSNDFNVPDYFYLNNGDGTFKEVLKTATGHVSMFGMGIDAADFNNDLTIDLIQAEMSPEDYVRAKVNMASMNPKRFEEGISMGFHYQYMQNSLQLNNGTNSDGIPIMSEISRFANLASTDWSWSTLFADLDNDGFKDIYITNGMKRDVNDNDINKRKAPTSFKQAFNVEITDYPSEPISNYVYRNINGYEFEKISDKWGLDFKGFSNGMSYGDLDNDGDLDMVINNIDQSATVYKNETKDSHYLRITLRGPEKNKNGLGAKILISTNNGEAQKQEMTLTRGFQSSVEPVVHFGLGNALGLEKLQVIWPDGKEQIINKPVINQKLVVSYSDAVQGSISNSNEPAFKEITGAAGVFFQHKEDLFDDYKMEPLLPYEYGKLGPALATGDVNGDGLEDFFVGNASGSVSALYLQNNESKFVEMKGPWSADSRMEDVGAIFADFDDDGDQDLYVVTNGSQFQDHSDRLYLNTSDGFINSTSALPNESVAGKTVAVADFDKDGLLDIFIGGRNVPGKYPFPASSILLKNNGGKDIALTFKNVTETESPDLKDIGMVTDSEWIDLDGDGWKELVLSGEWMPITIFKNDEGKLRNATKKYGLSESNGWWYTVKIQDVDKDGDMDIIAGNLGLNHKYKASSSSPFKVYSNDFDENGTNDIVLSYTKEKKEVPLRGLECSSQQIPAIGKRYGSYREFASADLSDIYGASVLKNSLHYQANTFAHVWFENENGTFAKTHSLPVKTQFSSINAIETLDYNGDEYADLFIAGNLYRTEAETPRLDSGLGTLLIGTADGYIEVLAKESGLFYRGDIKEIAAITMANGKTCFLLAGVNEPLRIIQLNKKGQTTGSVKEIL